MAGDSELDLLLSNYLAGQLSTAEREAFEGRLAEDAALRRELALARRICWKSAGLMAESGDADVVWARLQAAATPAPPAWSRHGRLWRVAAAVVLVLGAGLVWRIVREQPAGRVSDAPLALQYATPRGRRASFRLPDGTQVILGPATKLRSTVTGQGPRDVVLEGEAYFVVTHDARRPFTVRTAHGVARDLGTRFVVSVYPEEAGATVAVADGAVSLAAPGDGRDSLVLQAGKVGHVTAAGRLIAESDSSSDSHFAWTEGRLEFRGTPLADVAVQLGRWYDLEIRLADPELRERRLAASFKQESATEALQVIAATAGLRIEHRGNIVVLHSK